MNRRGKEQQAHSPFSHFRTDSIAPSHISATDKVIDLNAWHHAIHQVTGDMALRFNRATADDLKRWSRALQRVTKEMQALVPG